MSEDSVPWNGVVMIVVIVVVVFIISLFIIIVGAPRPRRSLLALVFVVFGKIVSFRCKEDSQVPGAAFCCCSRLPSRLWSGGGLFSSLLSQRCRSDTRVLFNN